MVDSDSDTETVNESCWKWKLLRFTSNHRSNFQQLISQGDSSVESVVLESPSSNLEIQNSTQDHLHSNHHHNNSHISLGVVSPGSIERSPSDKLLRVRPRSVGDISESLRGGPGAGTGGGSGRAEVVILHGSVSPTDSHPIINQSHVQSQSTTTTTTSNSSSNQNHHGNNGGSNNNGSSGGGGILSFFGVRFNKSGTRHLDRSSGDRDRQTIQSDSGLSDKPGKTLDRDHRYTKFPLTSSPSQSVQNNSNNSNPPVPSNQQHNHPHHPHHHNIPTSRSNPTISIIQSVPLQTDSPFDATHIKLTPQTITYAHPHKSPVPPVKGIIHGANSHKFLSNAVSSLGRRSNKDKDKEKDGVSAQKQQQQPPNSNNKGNKQLKLKSKSDNSLHRVTLNNNNSGSSSGSGSSSHNSGNNSSSGGNSSNNSNSRNINNVLSPHFYPQGEQRLNSVQLGDHATIRLPWTGFQRQNLNNLSTVTPARPTPNTHNNNFTAFTDTNPNNTNPLDGTVRYVECGLWSGSTSQPQQTHSFLPTSSSSGLLGSVSATGRDREPAAGPPRRRARSLERSSNFRIFPIGGTAGSHLAVSPTKGQQGGPKFSTKDKDNQKLHKSKPTKQLQAKSNSLERPSRHRIRQSLSPSEQEILLRNITFSRVSDQIGLFVDVPPALPKKKSKHSSSSKAPPLGKLHRSAPNSSFSSVESSSSSSSCGDCGNGNGFGPINKAFKTNNNTPPCFASSYPPSPPPRPPSTLKPESRLGASERVSSSTTTSSNSSSSPSSQQHPPPPPLPTIKSSEVTRIRESQSSPNPKQSNNCRTLLSSGSNCSSNSNSSATMNSNSANRRPVVPRSVPHPGDSGGSSSLRDPRSRLSPTNHSQTQGQEQSQTGSSASSTISTPSGMSLEDARNSGFINKPSKGWLHSDQLLSKEGVTYTVRYIGCLDVNTSMKSLDFDTRSLIAKECINHVCEAAGLKSADKKRKTDRRVVRILGLRPRLDQAGSDVHLTITSTCLKLTSLDTGSVIATHDLPNISFASGGDVTMLDFVAYVAKDAVVGRACFVLECGSGRAQDVITTVGQAFELRFKEYLQKRPAPPLRVTTEDPDREYYNDLPGKSPPESALAVAAAAGTAVGGTSAGSAFRTVAGQDGKNQKGAGTGTRARTTPNLTLPTSSSPYDNKDGMSVNLIDFEAPTPPAFGPSTQDRNLEALLLSGGGLVPTSPTKAKSSASANGLVSPGHSSKDPFNMQPFGSSVPMTSSTGPVSAAEQKAQLERENWFHGIISRGEAEALVRNDGDFLVRESQATPGQYVLTGLQNGSSKHLLLVDPEGVVRTKDREFDSVIHLIRYHSDNSLPIISAESMVLLRHPVPRSTKGQ